MSLKVHDLLSDERKARFAEELGFELPPYRLPYEDFNTDYGVGVIGLHWVVQIMHLPAYQAARFNVVGAAENNPDAVDIVKRKRLIDPDAFFTDDYKKLISRDDVQILDSSFGHKPDKQLKKLELAKLCAEAGKTLLLHKPIASTLQVAEDILKVSEDSGVPICVNQNCRYNPAAYTMKELLKPERLGQPLIIELQHYWRGDPRPADNMRAAVMQHVIHHADLIRYWVGSPCVSVYSRCQQNSNLTIYQFANGTVAYHMENHSGIKQHTNKIRIQTEKGIIEGSHNWDWHIGSARGRDVVKVCRNTREDAFELPLPELIYEPHWSDINKWLPHKGPYYDIAAPVAGMMGCVGSIMKGLSEGKKPDNHVSGGVESLRMALGAELSSERNQPVKPEEVPLDYTTSTEPL
ncbi:MAG: Gfo/Idh/MocA family protein [Candidatus Sumerlaeia bacterium]